MDDLLKNCKVAGSFRDPSGFLFRRDGVLYREVASGYRKNYDLLMGSGLYKALVSEGLFVPHEEVDPGIGTPGAYKVICPEKVPFISYPYEWCFSQLRDAALLTLKIEERAVAFGMSLKDASAYNVQFHRGRPVLIDTLSFEEYSEGRPWVAYRQFCQHFLAPLALMAHKDVRLNQLLRVYIDGIPLDLASSLLPFAARFDLSLAAHLYLHSKAQGHYGSKGIKPPSGGFSKLSLMGLIDNLASAVKGFRLKMRPTEWGEYYQDTNYSTESIDLKARSVSDFLDMIKPGSVWDLGANTGLFSRIAGEKGARVVSFDIDHAAVEKNYSECVKNKETGILPLLIDLTNPSPGIGWENKERMTLSERGGADAVLALALIHHLAISNNIPLARIAEYFGTLGRALIVEFVPKSDSQVKRLLASREDIFPEYTKESFEREFGRSFAIKASRGIPGTERTLYLMEKRP